MRTRGVGFNTAMMAAERGQRSSRKRETAQIERSDSEEGSPANGQGDMESLDTKAVACWSSNAMCTRKTSAFPLFLIKILR